MVKDTWATRVEKEFRVTYADALEGSCLHPAELDGQMNCRRLRWRSGGQVSLADAVKIYRNVPGYNEFQPEVVAELHRMFPNSGISVTVGREYSVVIYLHVPGRLGLHHRVEQFVEENFGANEIHWGRLVNNGGDASDDSWESIDNHNLSTHGTLRVWWD